MTLPNDNMTREMLAAQAHIHSNGRAMILSDWVNALPINNNAKTLNYIFRLMCILTHGRFFNQTKLKEEEGYLLTPASRLLLKDEPLSQVSFVQMELDPNVMDPSHLLSKWIKNSADPSTPFSIAHGKAIFECDEKDPKLNLQFNEAMASDSRLVISVVIENCKGVFEGLKSLVDVGGGIGIVAKVIADTFLQMNCIVFDLPHVIEGCEGSKILSYVRGNMLKFIPSADAILLKERNQQDWAKLFSSAGFSDYSIIPMLGLRSIIEVFP
ncbi:hypothetical protein RDI58_022346 [Solanum bulbocastanum]|uniref:O-methyltransferase C-terminal domain-containing protein n=1 Tax=Solanum bulbocastanum TaxID=147425 RepID=A0AAN8Y5P4_SOLBU